MLSLFCKDSRVKSVTGPLIRKGIPMTIRYKLVTGLAFSAVFLTAVAAVPTAQAEGMRGAEVVTNGPRVNPGDRPSSWSAERNVRDSHRYEALTHRNASFRADRMRKECGAIQDRRGHAGCVASFGRYHGSSVPSGGYRNDR
jgi:hypothetical protein